MAKKIPVAMPRDPFVCSVSFPSSYDYPASAVTVSLESLLRQVKKLPPDQVVRQIEYSPAYL